MMIKTVGRQDMADLDHLKRAIEGGGLRQELARGRWRLAVGGARQVRIPFARHDSEPRHDHTRRDAPNR